MKVTNGRSKYHAGCCSHEVAGYFIRCASLFITQSGTEQREKKKERAGVMETTMLRAREKTPG